MDQSLPSLLDQFQIAMEQRELQPELGGYFENRPDGKRLVVNKALKYEMKIRICFELIFRHCLDEQNNDYIPYLFSGESDLGEASSQCP